MVSEKWPRCHGSACAKVDGDYLRLFTAAASSRYDGASPQVADEWSRGGRPGLLVVQRPRDLTRADLKELRMALDQKGYSEANLRRAWADAKNVDIAASIIGFVRQAALGDALVPYGDRVRAAMQRVMASRAWNDPQRRWLRRIGERRGFPTDFPVVGWSSVRPAWRVIDTAAPVMTE